MTPESFCYWLKGWFELNDSHGFDKFQPSIFCVDTIKAHLDLVFVNVAKPSLPQDLKSPGLPFEEQYFDQNTGQRPPDYDDGSICQTSPSTSLREKIREARKNSKTNDYIRYC